MALILHALDPGLRYLGLSEFEDGTLVAAHLVRNPEKIARGPKAWRKMADAYTSIPGRTKAFVFEKMKVYAKMGGGRTEDHVDPDDLIELTGVGAWCAAQSGAEEVHCYLAREWKGTIPKNVHNKRILGALTPAERAIVNSVDCPPSLLHNVIDSVGIGLFHLGRMGGAVTRAGKKPQGA